MNALEIRVESPSYLEEHARISIAFTVERILDLTVEESGLGGFRLVERAVAAPYVKDYDANGGNRPEDWGRLYDLSNWGFVSARMSGRLAGGAVIAFQARDIHMLEGRSDLAVLWDLRVSPEMRGQGIGSALFAACERWAEGRGASQLKVETQNTNVPACKFYASRDCELGAVHRFAYPELPEDVQLLWYKKLSPAGEVP